MPSIDFNMFGPLMEGWIHDNMDCYLTITMQAHRFVKNKPRDPNKDFSQINSLVVASMDQYSALTEERKTVVCFLVFQKTGDPPRVTK